MPNTLVNKLTIPAYFAEEPNKNDAKNPNTETINMLDGVLYCFIIASICV